ncbi:MAG TPA: acetylornithine deacetylase [Gemmatimonadales bacterium]|nr:acetylornithine deacetylase [Gemmatimonadales bacterium]
MSEPTPLTDAALLERLVAFDTTSRLSNLPLVDFVCDYLDRPGILVERLPSPDGAKANLVVRAGPEAEDAAGLTLSGHTDVVPAEEPGWRSAPFRLARSGDAWVGRGTADMKGFLALAINRVAGLSPSRLRRPLALLLTYDEEVGTLGARRFAEAAGGSPSLPRDVVIGEPTSLRVVRLHKGMLRLQLSFQGRAAHSGYPHLGRNAIEPAARAIVALAELRAEMERERPPHGEHFPEVPYPALNVAMVNGGSAVNVIPDRCTVQVGIRLLPGMNAEHVAERVRNAVAAALPTETFELISLGESPAMMLDESTDLYRELCELVGQSGTESVAFATDAGWLQRAGYRCAVFGPGSIEVAHRPNESLPIAEFERAGTLLEALLHRRCLER